jgi:hypothetical protein
LEEERVMLTKKSPDKLISDIRGFIEVLLTIKNNNDPDNSQSKAELDSPSDSSMAFGKAQLGKHSVKSVVSLFSNKDHRRDLPYHSNLSAQANNDLSKADLKRIVHTEMGGSSAKNKEHKKSRDKSNKFGNHESTAFLD